MSSNYDINSREAPSFEKKSRQHYPNAKKYPSILLFEQIKAKLRVMVLAKCWQELVS
jgi:hypothetical protein